MNGVLRKDVYARLAAACDRLAKSADLSIGGRFAGAVCPRLQ